jgi:Bacterial Ig-like domain (group 3)
MVTTMTLLSVASFGALAAGGPAAADGAPGVVGGARALAAARPDSGASVTWGAAKQVPGISTLDDDGTGQLNAVSCAVAGDCSAGGSYVDDSTHMTQAFVVGESGGIWGSAQGLPDVANILNTGGLAAVTAISCAFAGNCGATGYYQGGGNVHPFVVAESGSTWDGAGAVAGTGTGYASSTSESCAAPQRCTIGGYLTSSSDRENGFIDEQLPAGAWASVLPLSNLLGNLVTTDSTSDVAAISCRSVGNCSAGGNYETNDRIEGFVVDEKNGTWRAAKEVAGKLNVKGFAEVTDVSCHSAGNCAAVGFYSPGGAQQRPFIVTSKNGTWGSAMTVPGIGALDTGHDSALTAVSCGPAGGAGNCTAGGTYERAADKSRQAFTVTEKNGTWGTARAVSGLAARNTGKHTSLAAISCVSPGNCSAAGSYDTGGNVFQVWVASQHNGSWGSAGPIAGLINLNAGGNAEVTALSCASVGSCGIVGYYYAGPNDQQPFVDSGAIALPTSATLALSAGTVVYGHERSEKLIVTVKAVGGVPPSSGTVVVKAGSTLVCTIALSDGAGSCRPAASKLKPGSYSLTARYGPTQNYMSSTSPAKTLKVKK